MATASKGLLAPDSARSHLSSALEDAASFVEQERQLDLLRVERLKTPLRAPEAPEEAAAPEEATAVPEAAAIPAEEAAGAVQSASVPKEAAPPPEEAPAPAPDAPAPAPEIAAPAPCPTLGAARALETARAAGSRWPLVLEALGPCVAAWRGGGAARPGPPEDVLLDVCYRFAQAAANVAVSDGAHGAHSPALVDDAIAACDVALTLGRSAHFPSRRLRARLDHLRTRGPGILVRRPATSADDDASPTADASAA